MLNLDSGSYPCVNDGIPCKYLADEFERFGTQCVILYSCELCEPVSAIRKECTYYERQGENKYETG